MECGPAALDALRRAAAPPAAEPPSYLAGLIDAGSRGRALSFLGDRYQQAVQARDGAALPSLSSVVNGTLNGSKEEAQATIDGLATNLDWFGKVANGTASLTDPETGTISEEAIRHGFDLAGFGITGGFAGVEARAGQTVLGAGPIRPTNPGPGAWQAVNESMSARAASYQGQVTGRSGTQSYIVNGTRFDGTQLLDAKGPGYAWAVRDGEFRSSYRGAVGLLDQAERQLRAANGLPITWHVAELEAAVAIRNLFANEGIMGIHVVHTPVNR